jgi:hypothetical protein
MADVPDILEVPVEIAEGIAVVRENRVRLEAEMRDGKGGLKFQQKHAAAAGALASALKALSTEARLWAAQATERAGKATQEQRTQAAIQHLTRLPDGTRLDAYRQLVELEGANVRPVGLGLK